MSVSDEQQLLKQPNMIQERIGDKGVIFSLPSRNASQVSDSGSLLKSRSGPPRLYAMRWPILTFFYLAVVINGIPFEVLVPITTEVHIIYGWDDQLITFASTVYLIMHPLLSFLCAQFIVLKGWAVATNLGILATILGCAVRLLVNHGGIWVVILGQALCGIGRPLILNSQAAVASNWFTPQARTFIMVGLNILHTASLVLTTMIPGKIFNHLEIDEKNPTPESLEEGKELTYKIMWIEFLISLVLVPSFFILKNKPATQPSKNTIVEQPMPFLIAMQKLLTNINFLLILIPYSLYFGLLKAFVVILSYILKPLFPGLTTGQKSTTTYAPFVGALISQMVIPFLLNRFKKYKLVVSVLLTWTMISLGMFYFAASSEQLWLLYLDAFFIGFFLMPAVPVLMELSCDIVHPLGSSFAVGAMYVGATGISVLSNQVFTWISGGTENSSKTRAGITIGIYLILMTIGLICFCFARIKSLATAQALKSESVMSYGSLLKKRTQSCLYDDQSMFNCSFNVGIVSDTPIIDLNQTETEEEYSEVQES